MSKPHLGSGMERVRPGSCSVPAQAQFSVSRCRFPPLPAGIVTFHNVGLWCAWWLISGCSHGDGESLINKAKAKGCQTTV